MNSFGVRSTSGLPRSGSSSPAALLIGFAEAAAFAAPRADALAARPAARSSVSETRSRLRYSYIPSLPPSRPNPDSRYPPKPAAASNRFVELIHTTPALIFGAMSSARLMLSLHTDAARPYCVLFARATASDGVLNVIATSTGPKISTCAIDDDGCTLVNLSLIHI